MKGRPVDNIGRTNFVRIRRYESTLTLYTLHLFKTRHICVWIRNVFVELIFVYGFILHLFTNTDNHLCVHL